MCGEHFKQQNHQQVVQRDEKDTYRLKAEMKRQSLVQSQLETPFVG
jgi:molybdopterin-guanine dinucleotide biosynthesis protein